ncbi:MAG TPA: hypothetical protein PLG49_01000 [Defluviitaleaceae bacterium]|nr:hypothetical protein [Defluviitaleaceae bacterium]
MKSRILGLFLFSVGMGMLLVFLLPGTSFVVITAILFLFLGYIFFKKY